MYIVHKINTLTYFDKIFTYYYVTILFIIALNATKYYNDSVQIPKKIEIVNICRHEKYPRGRALNLAI